MAYERDDVHADVNPSVSARRRTSIASRLLDTVQQRAAQRGADRALVDPVAAAGTPRLGVQRADRAVGQPVGQEVQVVEDDQRPELERRINEIAALVDFFAKRQNSEVADARKEAKKADTETPTSRTPPPQVENYILLGDFNVVSPEHRTMEALESKGFDVPEQIDAKHIPTDKRKHFYDQIAVRVKDQCPGCYARRQRIDVNRRSCATGRTDSSRPQ